MRNAFILVLLVLASLSLGQEYRPKSGETALRVVVEGRGMIFIKLHLKEAPKTTARIIQLAKSGFYDGQKFFRVEKSPRPFLAQIGDPASRTKPMTDPTLGSGGSGQKIPYEDSGYPNVAGAVGLSALPDNRDSGDSQFYMLMGTFRFLDGQYTVFGQVVQGLDVLRTIEKGDRVTTVSVISG
jgi:cyclophilin family peptidyl-prolyl cis-trans isomerase